MDRAGIEPGMRVLEPSAGTGNLAEEMRAQGVEVEVAEISPAHREVLEAKGFKIAGKRRFPWTWRKAPTMLS